MRAIQTYAADLLLKTGQKRLPINVDEIISQLGFKLLQYSKAENLLGRLGYLEYAQSVSGLSFRFDGNSYICYADKLSLIRRRNVIMHECAHLYLCHISYNGILGKCEDSQQETAQEREANEFATAVLAPPHLLCRKHIRTPQDIQRTCRVSPNDSYVAAGYLEDFKNEHPILCHPVRIILIGLSVIFFALLLIYTLANTTPGKEEIHPSPPPLNKTVIGTASPTLIDDGSTYYWTQEGVVYHIKIDCPALQRATYPTQSGGFTDASDAKDRLCKICGSD